MSKDSSVLENCQEHLNYRFKDVSLLEASLKHASSANCRRESNERLEFLGDAVLGLVICHDLFERFPNSLEGDLTKIKSEVVSRRVCARVADRLHLPEALTLGQGMEFGHHMPRSLAAAVLESVIAAIYLDGGLESAREFIVTNMDEEIRKTNQTDHQYNFKSQLQQHAQRKLHGTPVYEVLDEKGPDHAKCFEIAVSVGDRHFPGAWGPSKKETEQKAAWRALKTLGLIKDDVLEPGTETVE